MINGTAVHAFELDDIGPGGHNGSVTLSSALAIAEHRGGLSGAELINAIVVGIETAARVNECVGRVPHEGLGFHGPGLYGTFASVASRRAARWARAPTTSCTRSGTPASRRRASCSRTTAAWESACWRGRRRAPALSRALLAAERLHQRRQRVRSRVRRLLLRAHREPEAAGLRSHRAHEGSRQDLAHRQGAAEDVGEPRAQSRLRWRRSRRCARSVRSPPTT